MNGWIKIYKNFLDWRWYSDPNVKIVFLHLLLTANFDKREWKDTFIERGQVVVGLNSLAETLGLSVQQTRTALNKLEETGEINKQATNKYSIITICKYDSYQGLDDSEQQTNNNQITNEQQTNNKRATTNEEYKNIRNKEDNSSKENIKRKADRELEFRNEVALVANGKYEQSMIDNFCDYWTESNEGETKMRFEREKVFDKARRLTTWFNRSKNYGRTNNRVTTTDAEYRQQTAEAVRIASEFFAKGGSPF